MVVLQRSPTRTRPSTSRSWPRSRLSAPTVYRILAALMAEGMVVENRAASSSKSDRA
jgi:DNA-binding IclR family transcriptional regulator